jgi:hypothetical protein
MTSPRPSPTGRNGDRGQLILVAGFVIAVTFVALALVMNAAIFTENLATRSGPPGPDEALSYRQAVEQTVFDIVVYANRVNDTDYDGLATNVTIAVREYGALSGRQHAVSGAAVNLSRSPSFNNGTELSQNGTGNFSDATGTENWSLASGVDNTRDFTIKVSSLNSLESNGDGHGFRVVANESGDDWWFNVTRVNNASGDYAVVTVHDPSGAETTCGKDVGASDSDFWVNVTAGTVAGEDCTALEFRDGVSDGYRIWFENTTQIQGSYSLIVDREYGGVSPSSYGAGADEPTKDHTIYATDVGMVYQTSDLYYETTLEVAPSVTRDLPIGILEYPGVIVTSPDGAVGGDDGDTNDLNVGGAQALGGTGDVDGDGRTELPYIDSSGNLKTNDSEGEVQTLVDKSSVSNDKEPDTDKTRMATGSWQGSPTSVFYANANHDKIYRVTPGGSPVLVKDVSSNGANAVLGPGDIDGDGDNELVYADGSQEVRYIEPSGTVKTTGFTSGSSSGIGNGLLTDIDDDGTDEAIIVDGSNDVRFLDSTGAIAKPAQSSVDAAKSPLTAADVDGDGEREVVYIDASSANRNTSTTSTVAQQ